MPTPAMAAAPLSVGGPGGALRVAIVGGGWAGLAAAVEATRRGHAVTLFEMAAQLGGRARRVDVDGMALDNGQHILIGAYRQTLGLMQSVGVDPDRVFLRVPLALVDANGTGLVLGRGRPLPALALAVLRRPGWSLRDRVSLLVTAGRWAARRFRCAPATTVAALSAPLAAPIRRDLIDPLAVAALNTPVDEASAAVFLRVLRDVLTGARGSADLLLPRVPLDELLPEPTRCWLLRHGAQLRCGERVHRLEPAGACWNVAGARFDRVVLAASSVESARLAAPLDLDWSRSAAALPHQPIATVYLTGSATFAAPMVALDSDDLTRPAQFAFDLGALERRSGLYAFVTSGAARWVERGIPAIETATLAQAQRHWPDTTWRVARTLVDRRATFACLPQLHRPARRITRGVVAAGDYVEGPYPGTLEGAVLSGLQAAADIS